MARKYSSKDDVEKTEIKESVETSIETSDNNLNQIKSTVEKESVEDTGLTVAQVTKIKDIKSLVGKHFIASKQEKDTIIISTITAKYSFRVERNGTILFHKL